MGKESSVTDKEDSVTGKEGGVTSKEISEEAPATEPTLENSAAKKPKLQRDTTIDVTARVRKTPNRKDCGKEKKR